MVKVEDTLSTVKRDEKKVFKQETPLFKTETNKEVSSKEKPKVTNDLIQTSNKNIEKPLKENTSPTMVKIEDMPFIAKSEQKKAFKQEMPLYKTETNRAITTQELVSVKSGQHDETIPKEIKPMQNLEQLLQEDKVSHKAKIKRDLKGNFSMPTAKVVTPKMDTKRVETLETVLNEKGDEKSESHQKIGMASSVKTEGIEVKMHEAKQMVKYLSHDVKNAIDEYKSPFTRVKVDLNPQKLGEIELTVVQRGKNLHINLSSNNTAIHTLAMNLNDLKMQLNNNGINNASFTFNNNNTQSGDSSFGSQAQQQHQQQKEHARSEYSYGEREERNEEILSSLEIVVPHYA
ncbi:Flagellar hook-length control protein FliK [hydrothermal vent metagenome]|uniref:Flagellar hook-length control protein FliK n=1 Tax=hydrothermal vent metagenome TaxID=652676 RepID=A0A1W1CMN9_9ZZZZ